MLEAAASMESEEDREDESGKYDDYFREIGSGYRKNINHVMVEPMICQPTPKGLALLVDDFVARTGHDLRIEDQQKYDEPLFSRTKRLALFSKTLPADIFHQPGPVGVILTLGQQHAIPVLFVRKDEVKYVLIFDSNSGSMTKGYRRAGLSFPDCKVMLNVGTRQADAQSCITDAFEILCRAFTVDDLVDKINAKVNAKVVEEPAAPVRSVSRFVVPELNVHNFYLFRMPEELCFTAQCTKFVTEQSMANLQLPIRDSKGQLTTLENFMRSKRTVGIDNHRSKTLGINSYLHDVSIEHKKRIMELVDQKIAAGELAGVLADA
ncbi:hypothetical protein [Actimicrobium sp. CCI2.3]|uniref:hypothetical protein n=1 Tax=Actimicrobium sp. CCI2.3 TaxID=3048616 RepID=UPI002B24ACF4|nr:hypothetical protein [Actimicrobium sp. CCI2.3]MEB0023761.1 hypothetical protein [Actimicrobium sp. CCI2.3]